MKRKVGEEGAWKGEREGSIKLSCRIAVESHPGTYVNTKHYKATLSLGPHVCFRQGFVQRGVCFVSYPLSFFYIFLVFVFHLLHFSRVMFSFIIEDM